MGPVSLLDQKTLKYVTEPKSSQNRTLGIRPRCGNLSDLPKAENVECVMQINSAQLCKNKKRDCVRGSSVNSSQDEGSVCRPGEKM